MGTHEHAVAPWWDSARGAVVAAFTVRSRQVLVLAAIVGVATGLGVALFETVVVELLFDRLVEQPLWVLALMPVVGLAVAAVALRVFGATTPGTTDAYLEAFHKPARRLRLRDVPARMLAAIATLGFGGAMGLEGPSLYLGASIGAAVQPRFRRLLGPIDKRVLMVAGRGGGGGGHLQGTRDRSGVRARGSLPGRLRPQDAPPCARRRRERLPRVRRDPWHREPDPLGGSPALSAADLVGALVLGAAAGLVAAAFAMLLRQAKKAPRTRGSGCAVRCLGRGVGDDHRPAATASPTSP